MHTDARVAAGQTMTDPMHAKGGRIFCPLWHTVRIQTAASAREANRS